jgi:hypothetical protein
MSRVLSSVAVLGAKRPGVRLGPARRVVHAGLLRVALYTVRLATHLERVEVPARDRSAPLVSVHPYVAERGVSVCLVEVAVYLAVAGYFVAGLVGLFVG